MTALYLRPPSAFARTAQHFVLSYYSYPSSIKHTAALFRLTASRIHPNHFSGYSRSFAAMANQAAVKRAEDFVAFLNDSPTREYRMITPVVLVAQGTQS